ncbi:MAG: amidohydrolase family protein [Bacteroidia bacterium]|nr:amidohydrolase family protein [Bacteroidia bacterium]MDW8416964.1 amidohydrolase family protein [Bacteroidia bacterium]
MRRCAFIFTVGIAWAQSPFLGFHRGIQQGQPTQVALVGGNVWLAPGRYLQDGVILIKEGRILQVGERSAVKVPREAFVISYPASVWIYPAFVDAWSSWGLRGRNEGVGGDVPQYDPTRPPLYYPVDAVRLDFAAETAFVYETETAKKLREMGYAVAHVAPREGVLRGTGATLLLSEELPMERRFLSGAHILHAGFEKGSSTQMYPVSKMGAIALVRQILYDWLWYRQFNPPPVRNVSMERLRELWRDTLSWVWTAQTPEDAFRVAKLSAEWRQGGSIRWALLGTGYEYEWLPYLPKDGLYILPVGLPTLPPLHTAEFYMNLPLAALRRWECAPFRLKWLIQGGYSVALTAHKVPDAATFWGDLRTLARTGISPDTILLSLTRIPAAWLGLSDIGIISKGAYANLLVFSDTLWKEDAKLSEVWVAGNRSILNPILSQLPKGIFELSLSSWRWSFSEVKTVPLSSKFIIGEKDTQAVEVQYDPLYATFKAQIKHRVAGGEWTFTFRGDSTLEGTWLLPTGEKRFWQARLIALRETPSPPKAPSLLSEDSLIARRTLPAGFYGQVRYPSPVNLLIRNATVWTGDTVLPQTDVLIAEGKIRRIGRNLPAPPAADVLEVNGAALTAGIIDEHSHIAIEGGVNEYSDAVTSEVRIADVIDPTDVNIYRHLAGGVTTVQLLHGSANPIGGQSACIKLRWGLPADSLLFSEAPPFNKFALGENVKQSNWGDAFTKRYPQTRMGVEQVIADAFTTARQYAAEWESFKAAQRKNLRSPAPRRNLRIEALSEILQSKRYITCHSYVQSEILMLMRLAERFGFRVRTFTHVLEGYKVAPELKAHGAFASTFSDWWAYKYEVIEAIPHNPAILLKNKVPTCINSDDAEMGRRLNQEAAKVLRYGGAELGIDSLQAWRTVTVYPAQALGISHRVGYVREGYDADVVLWDKPSPLSVHAKVQLTLVDGRKLYDAKADKELYIQRMDEKKRLVEKAWQTADPNRKGVPLLVRRAVLWDCESIGDGEQEVKSP